MGKGRACDSGAADGDSHERPSPFFQLVVATCRDADNDYGGPNDGNPKLS
ncbi:MAG: hypothetical protein ACXVAA_10480 [Candidatus Binataceae bacterium]